MIEDIKSSRHITSSLKLKDLEDRATEEELLHFNKLVLSDLQRKELDSKSKYAPTITAQRGFSISNGEHISHGFFTKLAI